MILSLFEREREREREREILFRPVTYIILSFVFVLSTTCTVIYGLHNLTCNHCHRHELCKDQWEIWDVHVSNRENLGSLITIFFNYELWHHCHQHFCRTGLCVEQGFAPRCSLIFGFCSCVHVLRIIISYNYDFLSLKTKEFELHTDTITFTNQQLSYMYLRSLLITCTSNFISFRYWSP